MVKLCLPNTRYLDWTAYCFCKFIACMAGIESGGGKRKGDVSAMQASKFSKALTLPYTKQKTLKRKRIAFSCNFKYGTDTHNLM